MYAEEITHDKYFLKLKTKATTTLSFLESPNYSPRLNRLANFLKRKKRFKTQNCPYCKNPDTQELRNSGGYLKGAMGQNCRMIERIPYSSFQKIHKHREFEIYSCFCCGAFWHHRKYRANVLFDALDWLEYYSRRAAS